ncbi:hypothetical protein HYS50_00150, partial [Candidatus Woesearchaeota archaeon]|nr:hypothetical protein [Candidatus Woesearchaeota archaeon]
MKNKKIRNWSIVIIMLGLVTWGIFSLINNSTHSSSVYTQSAPPETLTLESKFAQLSVAKTNFCAKPDFIDSLSEDDRLQGSCCSKMDFHRYEEQV